MGKSIRSKREKRLRTQRRELAQANFYDKKDAEVQAKLAAILTEQAGDEAAVREERMEAEPSRGREGAPDEATEDMAVDGASKTKKALKSKGGIKKKSSGIRVRKGKKGRLAKKGKKKGAWV
ncbi:hypothetical protein KFL_001740130 [Klebsormidium nitens]|uniref:Uncharacterized protein n=1 Tax=Klebsormidium nitens TaxID=105231 RepID=A0A1Y1HZG9_KLENI|nr:hypothetical protein KFL_001740130 [Klebsormidium nitens]|eukprot:GAQ84054.1 hypothetical protein KFL_001740130 [Klebsormidium nitens]